MVEVQILVQKPNFDPNKTEILILNFRVDFNQIELDFRAKRWLYSLFIARIDEYNLLN